MVIQLTSTADRLCDEHGLDRNAVHAQLAECLGQRQYVVEFALPREFNASDLYASAPPLRVPAMRKVRFAVAGRDGDTFVFDAEGPDAL